MSGPLLPKSVIHPHRLPFTACSSPLLLIGSSTKITTMLCSASNYNLLLVRWPCYTAADSGQALCIWHTRCCSSAALWWTAVSAGLIILWETDALASYTLQAVVSYRARNEKKKKMQFRVPQWSRVYLNSCNSCFSAEYWLLLWDNIYAENMLYKKVPWWFGWRLVAWFDEIPKIGKYSCGILFQLIVKKRQITKKSVSTQIYLKDIYH